LLQAIDDDANQTGQMVAGLLQWPQGTFASKVRKFLFRSLCGETVGLTSGTTKYRVISSCFVLKENCESTQHVVI
jgi:hypothetical protein